MKGLNLRWLDDTTGFPHAFLTTGSAARKVFTAYQLV
jgi:hypothetical protein